MTVPSTSKSAYEQKKPSIPTDHERVLKALGQLGKANYETIANRAMMDRHAVGRRLSELEKEGKIYKPGSKSLTKNNCKAFDYCLTEPIKTDSHKQTLIPTPSLFQQKSLFSQ